jgi:hypothetical protein
MLHVQIFQRTPVKLELRRRPCFAIVLAVLRRIRGVLPGAQSPGIYTGSP